MPKENYGVDIVEGDTQSLKTLYEETLEEVEDRDLEQLEEGSVSFWIMENRFDTYSSGEGRYSSFREYLEESGGRKTANLTVWTEDQGNKEKFERKVDVDIGVPVEGFTDVYNALDSSFGVESASLDYTGHGDDAIDAYENSGLVAKFFTEDETVDVAVMATGNGIESRDIRAPKPENREKVYEALDEAGVVYDTFRASSGEDAWIISDDGAVDVER